MYTINDYIALFLARHVHSTAAGAGSNDSWNSGILHRDQKLTLHLLSAYSRVAVAGNCKLPVISRFRRVDVDGLFYASPLYLALIECVPTVNELSVICALPPLTAAWPTST